VNHLPVLAEKAEGCMKRDFKYAISNYDGFKLSGTLKNYEDTYLIDATLSRPRQGLKLDDILLNKVLILKLEFER